MKTIFSIITLSTLSLHAYLRIETGNVKNYLMSDQRTAQYTSGYYVATMQDGVVFIDPACILQPSPFIVPPSRPCPIGTTGFVYFGDINRDGVRDAGSYWSVTDIVRAATIKPFVADKVLLRAAPPSRLKRPSGNFVDGSLGVYYNVLTPTIKEYPITYYQYYKYYGFNQDNLHVSEYNPGVYLYTVPSIVNENIPLPINTELYRAPESMAANKNRNGFTITGARWSNGSMEADPRILVRFRWTGIDPNNTVALTDKLYFSMYNAYPTTGDMVEPEKIVYPTPDYPFQLDSSLQNFLEVLPFAFKKGDRAIARLEWARELPTTSAIFDVSRRVFDWRVRFVDSYEGHSFYELPIGTQELLRRPTADYDGDGVDNFTEFAYSQDTDGDDLDSTPEMIANKNIQPVMPAMQIDPVTLEAHMNVEKRINVGSSVIYTIQYSRNGRSWTTIRPNDRLFNIVENSQTNLIVRTKLAAPEILFMRAVATQWK